MKLLWNYTDRLLKTTPIFLLFSILIIISQDDATLDLARFLNIADSIDQYLILESLMALLISFAIPAFYSKLVCKTNLTHLGLIAPKMTFNTLLLTGMAFLFFIPSVYLLLMHSSMKTFYTLKHTNAYELMVLIGLTPLYYFTEEFFFRGFLFLSLWQRLKWHSFWITDIIFTLSHIGKPGLEILFCIPASVAFNALTLYTKSIYPAILVHSSIGIFCILFANYDIL